MCSFRLHLHLCVLILGAFVSPTAAYAQIVPDATLGDESSSLTADQLVRGDIAEMIEGGAARGSNLFHSFSEFNVNDGQRVYFANPAEIESILSRVTGNNPSEIFGTLGVDGTANLFLINPNGLIFGENAQLDIPGSFYGTTAEAVEIGEGLFSATAPEQSQLLAVSPSVSFWNYLTENSGNIINRGALAVEGDLVLAASQLDLENQVAAVGDVSLLATDGIKIRDTAATPFIAFAGGDLLAQGNQQVDIVALSHPDSGLFSYGDMILRSAERVGGDAHYLSGGNFSVENLDGSGGELFSPIDPIIRAYGDVEVQEYFGSSLHILAGGSVRLGSVLVTAPDEGALGIDFLQETVALSDGTLVDIDGGAQATIDVRAGVRPDAIGQPPIERVTGLNGATDRLPNLTTGDLPMRADITVNVASTLVDVPDGLILLTNNYEPNVALLDGDIVITGENAPAPFISGFLTTGGANQQSGPIFLDSRNSIQVLDASIQTSSLGDVGDVTLLANNTVIFDSNNGDIPSGLVTNVVSNAQGTGGDIRIQAENLEILNGTQISSRLFGLGEGGDIILDIEDTIRIDGSGEFLDSFNNIFNVPSALDSGITEAGQGIGGDIRVNATNLEIFNGGRLGSTLQGQGSGGNIFLDIEQTIRVDGSESFFDGPNNDIVTSFSGISVLGSGDGQSGNIQITARNLEVLNGAEISANADGATNPGIISLDIEDTITLRGSEPVRNIPSGIFSDIVNIVSNAVPSNPNTIRKGGDIQVRATNLNVLEGAQIRSNTFTVGDAGNILLDIRDTARFNGSTPVGLSSSVSSTVTSVAEGQGGEIKILANDLEVLNGAQLGASTFGQGDAGSISLDIRETASFIGSDPVDGSSSGAYSTVESNAVGRAGDVRLLVSSLVVQAGASLDSSTFGLGDAGNIILDVRDTALFDGVDLINSFASGASSGVRFGGEGKGGDVLLQADNLVVSNGAQLNAATAGIGSAGNVILDIRDTALFEGSNVIDNTSSGAFSNIQPSGVGDGGDVRVTATNLHILNGSQLGTGTFGVGNAGVLVLNIGEMVRLAGNDPTDHTSTGIFGSLQPDGIGKGGDIRLSANNLEIFLASLSSRSAGQGDAGNLIVDVRDRIQIQDGTITTNADFDAGGQIRIDAGNILLFGDSDIQTFVNSGADNGGDITITADAIVALDDSDILAFAADGRGGNVDLSRTAFFGQNFSLAPFGNDPRTLDGNDRVDINATGRLASGNILLPDVSFIQNTLTELPDNLVNPETLVSNSCIARSNDTAGSFTITGSDGLPSDSPQVGYSLSNVQPVPETNLDDDISIAEPHSVYQLTDGRLVMSRECNETD